LGLRHRRARLIHLKEALNIPSIMAN
jgi:hypothetical protein